MFKGEKEKNKVVAHQIPFPIIMCKENYHESEALQYYCVECQVPICHRCGQTRHNQHRKVDMQLAAEDAKIRRKRVIEKAKERIVVVEAQAKEQTRLMKSSEKEIEDTLTKVTESTERLIERLREHETAMKMKLIDIYKEQQNEHTKRLDDVQLHVTQLKASIEHARVSCKNVPALKFFKPTMPLLASKKKFWMIRKLKFSDRNMLIMF